MYPCFRQPLLVAADAAQTVLLAFAEGRNVSAAACAPPLLQPRGGAGHMPPPGNEVGGLVLRRSTDAGQTWGPPATIYSGNLDFYTAVRSSASGRLFLMVQQDSAVQVFTSSDQGASFSAPQKLAVHVPAPFSAAVKPAVGHGLEIDGSFCSGGGGCTQAGRLIMPFVCMNGSAHGDKAACPGCHACMLLSDDHGASWHFGAIGQEGSREAQVVQTYCSSREAGGRRSPTTSDACLYASERNFGATPGVRMWARSTDGGASFAAVGLDASLVTPVTAHWTGIVASVARLSMRTAPPGSLLVYSAPQNPHARAELALRLSADEGRSWQPGRVLFAGPAGYSDLAPMANHSVGIIFENGDSTFADRISFSHVPLSWLQQQ